MKKPIFLTFVLWILAFITIFAACNKPKPIKHRDFIVFSMDSLIADETWWIKCQYDEFDRSLVYTANDNIRQLFLDCTQCEVLEHDSIEGGHLTFFLLDSNVNPINVLNYE